MYNIEGTIKVVMQTRKVSETFQVREFVLIKEDGKDSKYNQNIMFQMTQDHCQRLDAFKDGDKVSVNFDVRGREWKSPKGDIKYFNTLNAWKVDKIQEQPEMELEVGFKG